jgi:pimeloyl-ACP methyl ester carboxylesterase/DNA-binding SARP family transcriptional activator
MSVMTVPPKRGCFIVPAAGSPMAHLTLSVLGELRVCRDGKALDLPQSRKSRALLAYLALTGRTHRRERLCEMFWEVPHDPRGALRWALSKLRAVVDEPDSARIVADREHVTFATGTAEIDLHTLQAKLVQSALLPLADLQDMAAQLRQPLLDGLDLPHSELFQSWLIAMRDEVEQLWNKVVDLILTHPDCDDHTAIRWARAMLLADPLADRAVAKLAGALRRTGRPTDAAEVQQTYRQAAIGAGIVPMDHPAHSADEPLPISWSGRQTIGFCRAADGVRIAYAAVGEGPPLVKAANWLNHLERDWDSPIWGATFAGLARRHRLIRYDERGNGLSDWDAQDISLEAFVRDLESVVDKLVLDRFPLLGMSQGCAVSIAYAVRHPERVSALILIGGYAAGWRIAASDAERETREAVMTLTRHGWGTSNPAYRHIFSQTFMPDAPPESLAWFDELQRVTTSPENAARFQDAFGDIDVRHLLGQVATPTLVLHARGDLRIPLAQGRHLAVEIPNARFVTLESRSHIILETEPAWSVMMREIDDFLQGLPL